MATTPISGVSSLSLVSGPGKVESSQPTTPAAAGTQDTSSADDAVSVDVFPSAPPPEVLAAISAASDSYDALAELGLHLSFDDDGPDGGLSITLHDQDGTELSSLKPSEALSLADGVTPTTEARTSDVDDQHDQLDLE